MHSINYTYAHNHRSVNQHNIYAVVPGTITVIWKCVIVGRTTYVGKEAHNLEPVQESNHCVPGTVDIQYGGSVTITDEYEHNYRKE